MRDPSKDVLRELLAHEGMRRAEARELVDAVGLTDEQLDALASGVGTAFHKALLELYSRRTAAALATIEREEDDRKVLAGTRLWQAFRAVAEDLEYFPTTCQKALLYTKDSGGEDPAEEDDFV